MRFSRQPFLTAAIVLVLAFVLGSGCTARQSDAQYEDRLDAALKARAQVTAQLDGGSLRTPEQYDAASRRMTDALDALDADPPPRNAAAAHASMIAGMEGMAVLLGKMGRCEALAKVSDQDRRVCRQSIGQSVYDDIRNDFSEANTIYRAEGYSLSGLGGDDEAGDSIGEDPEGGDEL